MRKILGIAFAALTAITACTNKPEKNSIVVYYSQTGATEKVAKLFAGKTSADIIKIDAEKPYNGDFDATIERCQEEMKNNILPTLAAIEKNVADYDTIYLGFPVWFGVAAPPMQSFVKNADFKDKVIVPFCTFGSGGLETSVADLKKNLKGAFLFSGYGVRNARVDKASSEIDRYLVEIGVKDGDIEILPDFSKPITLTKMDKAIYDSACGDYPMPLGTPVNVCSRAVNNGTEYMFINKSKNQDGSESTSFVYVLSINNEKPEFIKVVR